MIRTTTDNLVTRRLGIPLSRGRGELEQAQMNMLRHTVRYAQKMCGFYSNQFAHLNPEEFLSYSDLQKIPFTTSKTITDHGHRLLAVSQSKVARIITLHTSGSTGKPKRFSFTAKDLASTSDFFLYGMHNLVVSKDRVLVLLPFEQRASVGELLINALRSDAIHAEGLWPPLPPSEISQLIRQQQISCIVGLPQHLLAVSIVIDHGQLKSMLLCSDYASPILRTNIENNCGCETFLHYGTTESGLGGAVECAAHCGCHIRESDLLIEIVDPLSGAQLPDKMQGEVIITTLGREAMPLIRYRTGDLASLDRSVCICGGITARLCTIYGRTTHCRLPNGYPLHSQELDDVLFQLPGILDYRATLVHSRIDELQIEYLAIPSAPQLAEQVHHLLKTVPGIRDNLATKELKLGRCILVDGFAATHTLKRTILDKRTEGEVNAICA